MYTQIYYKYMYSKYRVLLSNLVINFNNLALIFQDNENFVSLFVERRCVYR